MVGRNYLLAGVALLSGCASVPRFDDDTPGSIAQLSSRVECEVLKAFADIHPKSDFKAGEWLVTYTITSEAAETAGVGTDPLGWVIPANIDKLVVNGGASLSRTATRTGTVEYNLLLGKKNAQTCPEPQETSLKVSPADFKLGNWVDQLSSGTSSPHLFSYSVDVAVTMDAHVSADVAQHHFSGSFGVSGERKVTRTVNFAFAKIPGDEPQKVYVTNFPSGGAAVTKGKGKPQPKPAGQGPANVIPQGALDLNHFQLQQFNINRINR